MSVPLLSTPLDLALAPNLRDVAAGGGFPGIAPGRLFRSSDVFDSETVGALRVRGVLDLRDGTFAPMASRAKTMQVDMMQGWAGLAVFRSLPCSCFVRAACSSLRRGTSFRGNVATSLGTSDANLCALYHVIVREGRSTGAMKEAMAVCADAGSFPLLVHCSFGKDRTGVLVMLLMLLAGAPPHAIVADYAASAGALLAAGRGGQLAHWPRWMQNEDLMRSPGAMMADLLGWFAAEYGSVELYLDGCGVGEAVRERVRANLAHPGVGSRL
jgi:hypothetical protein